MEQTMFKPKVLVTIIQQGWVRTELLPKLLEMSKDPRITISTLFINKRPYEDALNTALKEAREGSFDFLISFDHDNVPTRNPIDLIFIGKDVIGMPYPTYRLNGDGSIEMALLAMNKQANGEYLDHKVRDGLQEVDAVASGALVISKKVIDSGVHFARKWGEDGFSKTGIDFHFCEKTKENGFHIFSHFGFPASHYKELDLLSMMK